MDSGFSKKYGEEVFSSIRGGGGRGEDEDNSALEMALLSGLLTLQALQDAFSDTYR